MKNDVVNLILICFAYLAIGLILASNYTYDKTLKITQDSIETLIKIEMITEQQFDILSSKVDRLERMNSNRFSQND